MSDLAACALACVFLCLLGIAWLEHRINGLRDRVRRLERRDEVIWAAYGPSGRPIDLRPPAWFKAAVDARREHE